MNRKRKIVLLILAISIFTTTTACGNIFDTYEKYTTIPQSNPSTKKQAPIVKEEVITNNLEFIDVLPKTIFVNESKYFYLEKKEKTILASGKSFDVFIQFQSGTFQDENYTAIQVDNVFSFQSYTKGCDYYTYLGQKDAITGKIKDNYGRDALYTTNAPTIRSDYLAKLKWNPKKLKSILEAYSINKLENVRTSGGVVKASYKVDDENVYLSIDPITKELVSLEFSYFEENKTGDQLQSRCILTLKDFKQEELKVNWITKDATFSSKELNEQLDKSIQSLYQE